MPYAPTVAARVDMAPVPRVEVTFGTVPADAATATVYRQSAERNYRVRDGVERIAAGGFSLIDFEVPFQFEVQYVAEFRDAFGVSLGVSDAASVTVDFDGTVLHNPIDPERAVLVDVLAGTGSSLSRPMRGGTVDVLGRELSPWIGRGRGGLRAVPLNFLTRTNQAEFEMERLFGDYGDSKQVPVICIRSSIDLGLPRPLFAAVGDPAKVRVNRQIGRFDVKWPWLADEAAPPAEALVTPLLTYGDLEAFYSTYSALEAAYLSYLGAESDYSLSGVA